MTNEEKQLLLRDLCARLPYGVICSVSHKKYGRLVEKDMKLSGMFEDGNFYFLDEMGSTYSDKYIPYLRPMSSMTEDEKTMFNSIWDSDWDKALTNQIAKAWDRNGFENQTKILEIAACTNAINFLISHHFDYRGLIEKGLALEAPEGMYEIK